MTSQLNVDTIVDKAGSGGTNVKVGNTSTYVSDGGGVTQNTVQGLGKVWCHCSQSTPSIDDSLNSGSLTDDGTGLSTINFTNNMGNASYSAHCTHHDNVKNAAVGAFATSSFRLDSRNDAGTFADQSNMCGLVHGDLA
jgi:hypothetical protein